MSFLGGPRSCIGVKFSVIECVVLANSCDFICSSRRALNFRMKAVIHTLITSFRFTKGHPDDVIIPRTTIVTRPLVKGREHEGNMLPLGVELID